MSLIDCFIPFQTDEQVQTTVKNLQNESLVAHINFIKTDIRSTESVRFIQNTTQSEYTLIYTKYTTLSWVHFGLHRMLQIAQDTDAVMVYSDHFNTIVTTDSQTTTPAPVIDYQIGALRDDFDFGSVWLIKTQALKQAQQQNHNTWKYGALYELRLALSRIGRIEHINEFLYYDVESDTRLSGEKLFDYVDPRNRAVQIEMEQVCTEHLKKINAYLKPEFKQVDIETEEFEYEASVIIPCKNRVRTIGDAIQSALSQTVREPYKYNVIVVDDNSTDGTVDVIRSFMNDERLIYIAQDKSWHAIGGNWNMALHHPKCGRFAIQLDSDDMYHDETTIQQFIDCFHKEHCAMVVGTYQLTNFNREILPPGVIDHREWTPENGRNNALRINGLGAPRAFFTPVLREMNFPTTKYGEDYAMGLRISRDYQIGRIYNVLYDCRRWDDNSDANCDVEAMNRNNLYKDRLRTWELQARINHNHNNKVNK